MWLLPSLRYKYFTKFENQWFEEMKVKTFCLSYKKANNRKKNEVVITFSLVQIFYKILSKHTIAKFEKKSGLKK
jgi:hypothetical protein